MLVLKFVVNLGQTTRLVMSPALLNIYNLYEDALYVYTEEGKFKKRDIQGSIEHLYLENDESEES